MTTLSEGLFVDAVVVKGTSKSFTVSINHLRKNSFDTFEPLDLNPYSIVMKVLGSATADGEVLLTKTITQNSDPNTIGIIDNPANGVFSFVITKDDTINLGLGKHPFMIQLVDPDSLDPLFTLTEGGYQGQFNKLEIVQV